MAIRPIITLPDAKLRLGSASVARVDDATRHLLDDMIETMYDAPGIGLAAIQVGIPQRLVVLDLAKQDEAKQPLFLVNPEIVWSSEARSVYEEGCLSIPDYYEEVERPAQVRIRFLDRYGAEQAMEADGLLATAAQHEIDHLNGVLFIDHISKLKRDRVVRKFAKAARKAADEGRPFNPREGDRPASAGAQGTAASVGALRPPAMRLIFMGTPDFAVPTLAEVVEQGHDIAAVYTRAPAPGGRGMALRLSPIHAMADHLGLSVRTPKTLRNEAEQKDFAALGADLAVVVAYGLILPQAILDAPRLGCLNLHGSLLPRWRGAAPMQRAIMAGDAETGVMVMRMEAGLDTGPVGMAERIAIGPEMTTGDLHDRLAPLGADLMGRAVLMLDRGGLAFRPQVDEGVTYATKIDKAECRIDWSRPAARVHDLIRGLSPFPGAFLEADLGRGPERIKVLRSKVALDTGVPGTVLVATDRRLIMGCGTGSLEILRLQRAGKGAVDVAEFLRGTRIEAGQRLWAA